MHKGNSQTGTYALWLNGPNGQFYIEHQNTTFQVIPGLSKQTCLCSGVTMPESHPTPAIMKVYTDSAQILE